jgi:hypothetical protein
MGIVINGIPTGTADSILGAANAVLTSVTGGAQ